MIGEVKRTYSLNLIAWLRSHDINVHTYCEDKLVFGLYEETEDTIRLKEIYREDEKLHRFLNEFKRLRQAKTE